MVIGRFLKSDWRSSKEKMFKRSDLPLSISTLDQPPAEGF
jgi:hypothetical protein